MAFDVVTYALCKKYTNSEISRIIGELSEGMKFKGYVETTADLPSSADNGDLYIVKDPGCKAVYYSGEWAIFDNIPKKVSQLINDTGFITSEALVNLATKDELARVEAKIPSLDGYATETWVENKHYLTEHQDISGKADITYVDNNINKVKNLITWESGEGLNSVVTKGNGNQAKGEGAVAEGINTDANAKGTHTEGNQTMALANFAHAEGNVTTAGGQASHAEGNNTITNNQAEHAEGKFNKSNTGDNPEENTIHSIGIGKASGSIPGGERKNAFEVMESGDAYFIGVGEYDGTNPSEALSLQGVINSLITNKQDVLTAGENVTIENNIIRATDTKYTAGENVTISEDNVISSTANTKMGRTFTTKVTVGNLPAGSFIDSEDQVALILYKILYGESTTTVNLYCGGSDTIPTSKEGLEVISDQDVDVLLENGKLVKIVTGNMETGKGQYPVFACDKGARLVSVKSWTEEHGYFDYTDNMISIDKGSYILYYLPTITFDKDIGGTTYNFKFREGA